MTNHKEILRLKNLGLSNAEIAAACCCGRNTVTRTLKRASETGPELDAGQVHVAGGSLH
jgi:transposase